MPTLLACAIASIALVVTVGMQSPAVSVGLRWKPGPQETVLLPRFEVDGIGGQIRFGISPPSGVGSALTTLLIVAFLIWTIRWLWILSRRAPKRHVAQLRHDTLVLSEAGAQALQSGLAQAIQILSSEDRDLSNAVVQAWQGLQDAAATAGVHRRPAETASEFTARILYRSRGSAEPISVLLSLYQRVRFGEHTPSAAEIAAARNSLVTLVGLWQADFPKRRTPMVSR